MASRAKKTEGTPKDDNAPKNDGAAGRAIIVADLAELLDPRSGHSLTFNNEVLTDAQRLALLAKLREEWDSWETDEDVADDELDDFDDEYDLDVEEDIEDELDEEDEESFLNY